MPVAVLSLIQFEIENTPVEPDRIMWYLQQFAEQAAGPALSIVLIVAIAFTLMRALRTLVRQSLRHLMERGNRRPREVALKANTLSSVVESGGRMVIGIVAGMMVLSNLGVNIAPLIASAGVVGIAIGLGAQSLIKDFIGGFFILFEDQYGVGDVIQANGQSGVVEILSLRRTGLRAADGSFIIMPNGDMRTVQNMTKDWSRAVIDVDISYDEDVDYVIDRLQEMLDGIEHDPTIGDAVLAPADILGVQALGPYQVTIRAMVKTRPMEQWRVERELRRRIKRQFREAGIAIPYPHTVTVVRTAEDSRAAMALTGAGDRRGGADDEG